MPIGKARAFELAGATITNIRTAWDGVRPDGTVVFMGWQDDFSKNGAQYECVIWRGGHPAAERIGARQRWRDIQRVMEAGETALLLVAKAADVDAETREVTDVVDAVYSVRLEQRGDDYIAVALSRTTLR